MDFFNFILPIFTEYGYVAVFLMLLACGFGVPVPEDVTLVSGGVIAGLGYANVHTMVAVGLAGVLIGDGTIFMLGRFVGQRVLHWPGLRHVLNAEHFAAAQKAFARWGLWVMFVVRFLPGIRTPVFFTAGMTRRVHFSTWLLMDGLAALISVPLWVYVGHFGAQNWDWMFKILHRFQFGAFVVLGLLALAGGVIWWRKRQRS